MKKKMRYFIDANIAISRWFDNSFLPSSYLMDGNQQFIKSIAPRYISPGLKIYDVGGGKQPYLNVSIKNKFGLYVVGIDIDGQELESAPKGAYDETICADISNLKGRGDGDVVICQAVLEHVQDTDRAISSIATLLKPGGKVLIFVPSRNAIYATLNRVLPEYIKQSILWSLYPRTRHGQGFKSYYHKCTPNDLIRTLEACGMVLLESHYYYISSYFSFFFPVYILWRIWILLFKFFSGNQAAETFTLVLEKQH